MILPNVLSGINSKGNVNRKKKNSRFFFFSVSEFQYCYSGTVVCVYCEIQPMGNYIGALEKLVFKHRGNKMQRYG